MKHRFEFIQYLIDKFGYKTYLEIGVAKGECFHNIHIDNKTGVDPNPESAADIHLTSDEFFASNRNNYDIVFIDGLHHSDQVYKDIINALDVLSYGGTIVCHDMWPTDEWQAGYDQPSEMQFWTGDCYKGLLKVINERNDILVHVFYDLDWGTTIIRKTMDNPILTRCIPWDVDLDTWHTNAREWAGAMSIQEYLDRSEEVVICAIAKQEQKFLDDWCKWHLNIGFDRIYLYDNNDEDSSETYEWLQEKYNNGVEVRRVRGLKAQQNLQYQTFYDDNIFKWVAYIDIDEYIKFKTNRFSNIKNFINTFPDTDSFALQWNCYKANPTVAPINIPIYEYCTEKIPDNMRKDTRSESINGWFKSITRSGLYVGMNEHQVWSRNSNSLKYKDCNGVKVTLPFAMKNRNSDNDDVVVNHYIIRNIEDFYYNKYMRGHAGLDMRGYDGYTWWNWNQNLNYFTDIQWPLSKEEQLFLARKGYKPNWTFRPKTQIMCHVEPLELGWYADGKAEVLKNIFNMTDSSITLITDTTHSEHASDRYGFTDFFNADWYHPEWATAHMKTFHEYESFGQPIIVMNLGYDLDNILNAPEFDKIPDIMTKSIGFMSDSERLKKIMHDIIENPNIMAISKDNVEFDPGCGGYKELIREFLFGRDIYNLGTRIKDNTYITSAEVYKNLYNEWLSFMSKFGTGGCCANVSGATILSEHANGRNTLYDAWQFVYPCLVPELKLYE